jgi:GNAT superfamily N-acetyltransferase
MLAWKNECEGWLALGKAAGPQAVFRLEEVAGVVCAWWQGGVGEMENYLMVDPTAATSPTKALKTLNPLVKASRAGSVLRFLASDENQGWRQAAEQQGYTYRESSPLMIKRLDPSNRSPSPPPYIQIRPVENQEDYQTAFEVIHTVYRGSRQLTAFFNPHQTVRIYLAEWEGVPAASATLWRYAEVAGVYSVATLPEFRRRGLAVAVVNALLNDVIAQGFHYACLRTTDNLIPLYQRSGFAVTGRVARFFRPSGG